MQVLRDTSFQVGQLTFPLQPPDWSMVVVIKATFDLHHKADATLAAEQRPLTGPLFEDEDPDRALLYPGDFALAKRHGECFLMGSCYAPRGAPVKASMVGMKVGGVEKAMAVYGDRRWKSGLLGANAGEPEPFVRMPLTWDRAFGGPGHPLNPVGRGAVEVVGGDGERYWPLPNLDHLERPIANRDDAPTPVGAFPVPSTWPARRRFAGTFDERWRRDRAPWWPNDFDPRYYQAAPPDQWSQRPFVGNEQIIIRNVHPTRELVWSRLPAQRARVFVERGPRFDEVPLALDTITVDGDAMQALCVWRGHVAVTDEDASEVSRLFALHEPVSQRRPVEACREQLDAFLRAKQLEDAGFVPSLPQDDPEAATMAIASLTKTLARSALGRRQLSTLRDSGELDATLHDLATRIGRDSAPRPEAPPAEAPPDVWRDEDREEIVAREREKVLDEIGPQLAEAGIDVRKLLAEAEERPKPSGPMDPDAVRKAFADSGQDIPPELEAVLAETQLPPAPAPEPEVERDEAEAEPTPRERLVAAYRSGASIEGDFTGVVLTGLSLPGLRAPGAILAQAHLDGVDLSGADLSGAVLSKASMRGASLKEARLGHADLADADLEEADLTEADLERAVLERSRLVRAKLVRATLAHAELLRADLTEADLTGAQADEADFTDAVMQGVRAVQSSLVDARLMAVRALGADFTRSDLTKLRATRDADLTGARFMSCVLHGARFRSAALSEANFSFSDMDDADFTGADLRQAILDGVRMRRVTFLRAKLAAAQVVGSDLMEGNLQDADLTRADLRGSNLFAAELWRAKLDGAQLDLALTGMTKLGDR